MVPSSVSVGSMYSQSSKRRQSVLTGFDHGDSRMAVDRMATGLPTVCLCHKQEDILCPASPLSPGGVVLGHSGENLCISKGAKEKGFEK